MARGRVPPFGKRDRFVTSRSRVASAGEAKISGVELSISWLVVRLGA